MNVAPTNATQPSPLSKGDPIPTGTTGRMLPDGTDLPGNAPQDDTFGRMLSRGMTGLADVLTGKTSPLPLPVEPGAAIVDDGSTDASVEPTDRSRGFGVVVTDLLNGEAGTSRSTKRVDGSDDALPVDSAHDDAAANDLAAQLALVSQWAGIAKPAPSPGAQGGDSLDLRDKLATVRGTASPTTAASTTRSASPVGMPAEQPQDAASLPFATGGRSFTRDERGIDVGATAAATVKTDRTARASDNVQASIESAAVAGESGTVRTAGDAVVAPSGAFAQQIAAAATTASPEAADVSAVRTMIHAQLGTPAWSREVGQATLRIATGDLQSASLQINPEHLGPVDVQVRIDNGVAHLSFDAAHADTRQAIESSRATLDRLFADQGLKIGDCAVGDSSTSRRNADADAALSGQSQRNGSGRWDQAGGGGNAAADVASATTITTRLKALGLVDTFA